MHLHYVLGITKAYSTRVGGGPFPTELSDGVGERLRQRGQEFGATTGRPRRTGWFDAAALKRSIQLNGCSGLCITKLDVLDGVEAVKICTGYEIDGQLSDILPVGAEELARCVLPMGTFTQFYWTVNARSLMNFISLRAAETAQLEIRRYADAVEELFAELMPVTHAAFVANDRTAP